MLLLSGDRRPLEQSQKDCRAGKRFGSLKRMREVCAVVRSYRGNRRALSSDPREVIVLSVSSAPDTCDDGLRQLAFVASTGLLHSAKSGQGIVNPT